MKARLKELEANAISELESVTDIKSLDPWRVYYLGKNGSLTQILRSLKNLSPDERKSVGAQANKLKLLLQSELQRKKDFLKENELSRAFEKKDLDISLPGRAFPAGRTHPITQSLREICHIFSTMGFGVVEGPEVELDYYNFEALNIPPDHPARDMFDTLWLDSSVDGDSNPMLLRTHTSPMQIRIMENSPPPIRVIVPGKVYRYEASDATHESMFTQVEGLAVGEGITLANLKGTLFEFASRLFGAERKMRFRCDYFPFVEPGVEMSIECLACGGNGCKLCSNSGWLEILGAGMVHPDVLKRVGYDPQIYSGFAFGLGVERIPMLKYGVEDIRLFYENDTRFLKQF
ncbi:MAG: phenylalanine--tRNA ligase subunit alpha [Dehalococcoidia bacterium]|nr:phenylalanine--tRNA ligase subunit alpha [Dehalococcoidia bacterium]